MTMTLTLRLDDDDNDALRAQAAKEGRSMQLVAETAIRECIRHHTARADAARETEHVIEEYREALERLGNS